MSDLSANDATSALFGPEVTWKQATLEEAGEVATFVLSCIRQAWVIEAQLGPQEAWQSEEFANAYKEYRSKSIINAANTCRILRKASTSSQGVKGEILGYIEIGPKVTYAAEDHIDFEIICLFCKHSMKGKGVGTAMVASILSTLASKKRLVVGQHTMGNMTVADSPYIGFYRKLGGVQKGLYDLQWIGGVIVPCAAFFYDAQAVEKLVRYGDSRSASLSISLNE